MSVLYFKPSEVFIYTKNDDKTNKFGHFKTKKYYDEIIKNIRKACIRFC